MKVEMLVLLVMAVLVLGPLASSLLADERPVEPTGPMEFAGQVDDDGQIIAEFLSADDEPEGDDPGE